MSDVTMEIEQIKSLSPMHQILIVEDNQDVSEVLKEDLLHCGFQGKIHQASNFQEAKRCLLSQAITIVLLDINLKGQSGLVFLQEMKRHSRFRHLKVLMISAENGIETILKAVDLGAVDYLVKPWTEQELIRHLVSSVLLLSREDLAG